MLNLPSSTQANRFLAKKSFETKIVNGKRIFENIEKITLKYKLSPSTINIEKTKNIAEILIFEIVLKEKQEKEKALPIIAIKNINELVKAPILFKFIYEDRFCFSILYKEQNQYFFSSWNEEIEFEFSQSNLQKVYENIIQTFFKTAAKNIKNDFQKAYKLENKIESLQKDIKALENKISKEKQFKKKLEYSQKLKPKENELENILKEIK
ncbi:MAG: hypothetical protein CL623_10265 [Arcobacter sp.]|nr:hypothetical protein [Arcobacter sp.]|tara:strand:- start:4532 stop:5161 length:630 start_codon:yes stop_codon:yes gene_type:complete